MASFRGHLSFGAIVGIAVVAAALSYSMIAGNLMISLLLAAVLVGSILPDVDSDDSLPFQILFFVACISSILAILPELMDPNQADRKISLLVLVFALLIGRFVIRKLTHHRGVFHSIPAMLLSILITFLFLDHLISSVSNNLIISLGVGLGYLGHLVLDEVFAAVSFRGIVIKPKKSFGNALKLKSNSIFSTAGIYLLLMVLFFTVWPKISISAMMIGEKLFKR